ncbi:MAG: porin family protein [Flavobacteriales bacterium]
MRSLLIGLFLMSLTCMAQDGHHGPRLGLGMATQSVGGLFQNTNDLLLAPILGWYIEAPVHPQVSIMPELLWMTKGAVVRNQTQGVHSRSALHYLEIPVNVKISTDAAPDGMYLLIGPSFGMFVSGRYQSWLYGDKTDDNKYTLSSDEQRFQFSGVVGLGMEGPRTAFDVRAQTSLTPFDAYTNVQNVVYSLTFGYRLSMVKKVKAAEED